MNRRSQKLPAALVATVLTCATAAFAADDAQPAAPPGAPATGVPAAGTPADGTPGAAKPAKPRTDMATGINSGDRVRVRLKSGGTVEGVVAIRGVWERRDAGSSWVSVQHTEKSAGIRVWFVGDLDGFQFVPVDEIAELKSLGALSDADRKAIETRRAEAAKSAEDERKRLAADKAYVADASDKAKSLVAEVEKARLESRALAAGEAKRKLDESRAKRWAELLAKFPPDKWSLDTPKEIETRKLIIKVFPSDEELEFLKSYDEWREAVTALKAAEAMMKKASGK